MSQATFCWQLFSIDRCFIRPIYSTIPVIVVAAYLHDVGWFKLMDKGKIDFDEMLKYVFNEKFNFLLIDTNEDFKNMYHKNLNKRLVFPHMEDEEL